MMRWIHLGECAIVAAFRRPIRVRIYEWQSLSYSLRQFSYEITLHFRSPFVLGFRSQRFRFASDRNGEILDVHAALLWARLRAE